MVLAEGIGQMIRREYPGARYTYEPGSLASSVMMALRSEVPVALSGGVEIFLAQRGVEPFEDAP